MNLDKRRNMAYALMIAALKASIKEGDQTREEAIAEITEPNNVLGDGLSILSLTGWTADEARAWAAAMYDEASAAIKLAEGSE